MVIHTKDLGQIEIDEQNLITMVEPIYGFEQLKKFAVLSDTDLGEEIKWLQSVEDENVCFVLVDPRIAKADYQPNIPAEVLKKLHACKEEISLWSIAVIPADFRKSTVNLKSPIIINPLTHQALQVILEQNYPIRQPLISQEGGSQTC